MHYDGGKVQLLRSNLSPNYCCVCSGLSLVIVRQMLDMLCTRNLVLKPCSTTVQPQLLNPDYPNPQLSKLVELWKI